MIYRKVRGDAAHAVKVRGRVLMLCDSDLHIHSRSSHPCGGPVAQVINAFTDMSGQIYDL